VSKPVAAVWGPLVERPFGRLPRPVKLGLGWLALLSLVFGSGFGFPLPEVRYRSIRCALLVGGASDSNAPVVGNHAFKSCHLRPWSFRLPVLFLVDVPQTFSGPMVRLCSIDISYYITPILTWI
jgi:hypothetical protein